MEGVNSVKVLGTIEKERVNGKEDFLPGLSIIESEGTKKKENVAQLEKIPVKSAAVENPVTTVKPQTKKEDTAEIRDIVSDPDAKIDLNAKLEDIPVKSAPEVTLAAGESLTTKVQAQTKNVVTADIRVIEDSKPEAKNLNADLERAAIERLAENERLAEKERQEKIRRREELDRMARLKRILTLVRAPELDSVAKIIQVEVDRVEMTHGEEIAVLKGSDVAIEINPVLKIRKIEEAKELTKLKPLAESESVVETNVLRKKQITEYEGIVRLERMSKSERISEIDRLVNLELEAEAKRSSKVERMAELERLAELERVAKMKRLTEIDLKADKENAEKERVAEEKRQKKIQRKEELERVARLQRVLAAVLASESDQAVEAQAADLERVREKNRKDEWKLLEELGVIPKETKTETGKGVRTVEGEILVAPFAIDAASNTVNMSKAVSELKEKDVSLVKGVEKMTEVPQFPEVKERFKGVDVETLDSVEQPSPIESDIKVDTLAEAERNAKITRVAIIEDKVIANHDTKRKRREELERVLNMQRNTELNRVAEIKQMADLEKAVEMKRRQEMNILEELGIIPKPKVGQTHGGEVNPVDVKQVAVIDEDAKSIEDAKPMTEVKPVVKRDAELQKVETVKHIKEQKSEIKLGTLAEVEREASIKHAAEMERKAKADREARIKKREELVRVSNLQRVVAMVDNEEFDYIPKMKNGDLQRMAEKKRREDMKVVEELGLFSKEQEVQQCVTNSKTLDKNNDFLDMTPVEDANLGVDFKAATDIEPIQRELNFKVQSSPERVIGMEQISKNDRLAVNPDVEKRLTELRVAQMKRVAEMGRVMKMGKTMKQEDQRDFNHIIETERIKEATELKRVEEIKLLEKSSLSDVKRELVVESKAKGVKESRSADFVLPEKRAGVESVIGVEREELKPAEPRRAYDEVKRETAFELVELKRLKEMKRVVGMERVSGRDCEWDGQMTYVGKA